MTKRKQIILVDDSPTNLIVGKNTLSDIYDTLTVPSGEKLLKLLKTLHPDLILLDVGMPGMDGYEVIRRIKENEKTKDIPVIFLTAKGDVESELQGLTLGAIDYISKPFSPPLLRKRVETHLLVVEQRHELKRYNDNLQDIVREKTRTVVELQNAVISTVAELVECRDDVTGSHISRTQSYLRILLNEMIKQGIYTEEVSQWELEFLLPSAQLHDVGKIMIPDYILKKSGKLTDEEYEKMKQHPVQGALIIEMIEQNTIEKTFLMHAKIFALNHHEKWDGSGYPSGLRGTDIPLQGRLMALVDVYDAMVSERPYKEAMSHEQAKQIICEGRGSHFDPILTDVFLEVADQFASVKESMSNGSVHIQKMLKLTGS